MTELNLSLEMMPSLGEKNGHDLTVAIWGERDDCLVGRLILARFSKTTQ